MTERTTIKVDPKTRDRLRAAKQGGESYDETINRLLEEEKPARLSTETAGGEP